MLEKNKNEKTHTLNKHIWGHKTLWKKYNFGKKHWLLKKKGKNFKSFEFLPHLSLKILRIMFFLKRLFKNKILLIYIYIFQTLLKIIIITSLINHLKKICSKNKHLKIKFWL